MSILAELLSSSADMSGSNLYGCSPKAFGFSPTSDSSNSIVNTSYPMDNLLNNYRLVGG